VKIKKVDVKVRRMVVNMPSGKSSVDDKYIDNPTLIDVYMPECAKTEPIAWRHLIGQVLRFCLVGGLNTILDLLVFNCLLILFPTHDPLDLVVYNSLAYAFGGINSFFLNKYWTFRRRQRVVAAEIMRFIVTTLFGICVNDVMLWICSNLIHLQYVSPTLWANVSKILAIFGTFLISYTGMRLWVFSKTPFPPSPTTSPGEAE
jgi:putative flippase GtrA